MGVTTPKPWPVILEPAEAGGFTSQVAEYPGAISEGETEEEAIAMVMEALQEMLAYDRETKLAEASPRALIRAA